MICIDFISTFLLADLPQENDQANCVPTTPVDAFVPIHRFAKVHLRVWGHRSTNAWKTLGILVAMMALMALPGCDNAKTPADNAAKTNVEDKKEADQTAPVGSPEQIKSSLAAKAILEESIAAYRKLTTYEDSGVLKLRVPLKDKPVEESEPMRIAYEAPNKLAIRALDLQSCWKSTTFESIFRAKDSSPFGNQRLVRPRPEKLDLTWLILDHLEATLDNPTTRTPIQLQMLFDENALSGFRNEKATLSLLSSEMFDSRRCERVRVVLDQLQWTLWIDAENRLLRKYVLPVELIDAFIPNLPPDLDRTKMEIAVELSDAKQGHKIEWTDWQLPEEPEALLVRRFIQPPFALPPLLGQNMAPFDLKAADGTLLLDSAQRAKPITVMCWVGLDELSELFVKDVMEANRKLTESMPKNSFEIILVSKAPAQEMKDSLKKWNCDYPLAIDVDNLTEKVFRVPEKLSVVILDKKSTVQYVNEFGYLVVVPTLLRELFENVDPAARARLQAIDDQARYNSRLHRAIIERAQVKQQPPIEKFPFTFHETELVWNAPFTANVIAAAGEQYHAKPGAMESASDVFASSESPKRVMTVLDDMGDLHTIDAVGKAQRVSFIPVEKATDATRMNILPDPWDHDRVAIIPEGLPRFWIVETINLDGREPTQATEYELEQDESPIAFVWTALGNKVSLTLATNQNRLLAYDPETKKLSVSESKGAIAIVPTLNANGECIDWNACDSFGKLTPIASLPSSLPPAKQLVDQLPFRPLPGSWTWGTGRDGPVMLAMADLVSGEAGTILRYQNTKIPSSTHPLNVRAEQCRILSSTKLKDGSFYWLSSSPRSVLHLQTNDSFYRDQLSFGKPVLGASLLPFEMNARMVVAIDNSVSCWNVKMPPSPIANTPPEPVSSEIQPSPNPGSETTGD